MNELFQGVVVERVDLEWFDEDNIPEEKEIDFDGVYNLIQTKANDLLSRKMNG